MRKDVVKAELARDKSEKTREFAKDGEAWDAGSSIELVYDPELIAQAAAVEVKMPELLETDYVLLSEEEAENL